MIVVGQRTKSAVRMAVLLSESGLPLRRYSRGQSAMWTTAAFGPRPGEVYDWGRGSPVIFTTRQVEHALASGFIVEETDGVAMLTDLGREIARDDRGFWVSQITNYCGPHATDWRTWR